MRSTQREVLGSFKENSQGRGGGKLAAPTTGTCPHPSFAAGQVGLRRPLNPSWSLEKMRPFREE